MASIAATYVVVIIVWSTTPLAIKFSSESVSGIAAAGLRMLLGAAVACLIMWLSGRRLAWTPAAIKSYLAGASGLFLGMSLVYLASPHVPSGLISVLFGLSPLFTGIFAVHLLGERPFDRQRWLALLCALLGLLLVFGGELRLGPRVLVGLPLLLASVAFFCLSAVLVKRVSAPISALQQTTGSLLFSLPGYWFAWLLLDGSVPVDVSLRSAAAIVYLALFGSVLGFLAYFSMLQLIGPVQVALIPLVTPVFALLLGNLVAGEKVGALTLGGAGLIAAALLLWQWAARRPVVA